MEGEDRLLTVNEVAAYLRVDGVTIRRWIKAGAIPAVTLPNPGKRQYYRVRLSVVKTIIIPEE